MIISHRYRFIFWKPYKCASTSLLHSLGSVCDDNDVCSGVHVGSLRGESVEPREHNLEPFQHLWPGPDHATPRDIRSIVRALWGDQIWRDYRKVTVVRNPWEICVSQWDYWNHVLGKPRSLADCTTNWNRLYWFEDHAPLADTYLRYERLAVDFAALCRALELPPVELPHLRRGQRRKDRPCASWYDRRTAALVRSKYDREIEYFGYVLDGHPSADPRVTPSSIALDDDARPVLRGDVGELRAEYARTRAISLPGFLPADLAAAFVGVVTARSTGWLGRDDIGPGAESLDPSRHGVLISRLCRLLCNEQLRDMFSLVTGADVRNCVATVVRRKRAQHDTPSSYLPREAIAIVRVGIPTTESACGDAVLSAISDSPPGSHAPAAALEIVLMGAGHAQPT